MRPDQGVPGRAARRARGRWSCSGTPKPVSGCRRSTCSANATATASCPLVKLGCARVLRTHGGRQAALTSGSAPPFREWAADYISKIRPGRRRHRVRGDVGPRPRPRRGSTSTAHLGAGGRTADQAGSGRQVLRSSVLGDARPDLDFDPSGLPRRSRLAAGGLRWSPAPRAWTPPTRSPARSTPTARARATWTPWRCSASEERCPVAVDPHHRRSSTTSHVAPAWSAGPGRRARPARAPRPSGSGSAA